MDPISQPLVRPLPEIIYPAVCYTLLVLVLYIVLYIGYALICLLFLEDSELLVQQVPDLEARHQDFEILTQFLNHLEDRFQDFELLAWSNHDLDFESLTRLIPDLEVGGTVGEVQIPLLEVQGTDVNSDVCVICLEGFRRGEACRVLSSCKHMFHPNCIYQWLWRNKTCPICRSSTDLDMNTVIRYVR